MADPRIGLAVGFPGQGGDWQAALRVLSGRPDHPLVDALHAVVRTRHLEQLDGHDTRHAQPVLAVAGLVTVDDAGLGPDTVAAAIGHSVGEITAATFAGAIDREDAVALIAERGELGHRVQSRRPGAMAAIMRLGVDQVEWLVRSVRHKCPGVLELAVENSASQFVLSGDEHLVDVAVDLATELGGVARRLPIGGPFHSSLMIDAVPTLRATLERVVRRHPVMPVVLSTAGRAVTTAADLVEGLARALVLPVRWPAAVQALRGLGLAEAYDAGPGDTLSRLERFAPEVTFLPLPSTGGA